MKITLGRPLPDLCAFRAVSLAALTAEAPPSRLVVAPWGSHDLRKRGRAIVSQATVDTFSAGQAAIRADGKVAIDFEHNTVPGTPAYQSSSEPRPVAAWAVCSAVPNVGLVYDQIEWTPQGLEALRNKSFQDLSPAVFRRPDGTVIALHSVALCRHGEIEGLTISAAASAGQAAPLTPLFAALSAAIIPESPPMKPTAELIALLAACGVTLTETADEAAITEALKTALANVKKEEAAEPAALTALTAQVAELKGQITTLNAGAEDAKKEALIAAAKAEGKVIPLSADLIKQTSLTVLSALVAAAKPGEVPLGNQGGDNKLLQGAPDAFSAEQLEVFKSMGLTEEEVRKHTGMPEKQKAAA